MFDSREQQKKAQVRTQKRQTHWGHFSWCRQKLVQVVPYTRHDESAIDFVVHEVVALHTKMMMAHTHMLLLPVSSSSQHDVNTEKDMEVEQLVGFGHIS